MKRDMESFRKALLLTLPLTVPLAAIPTAAIGDSSPEQNDVFINEIEVSTTGTDWEFIELQSDPGTDLSNLTLLVIESDSGLAPNLTSNSGSIDKVISLSGQTIGSDGLWLGMSPAGYAVYGVTGDMSITDNSFENSSATYMLVDGFTGAQGDDLDTDDDGVLDITPWTAVLDSISILDSSSDFVYGAISAGPDGSYLPAGAYRCPDAPSGNLSELLDFNTADGTPGAYNCSSYVTLGSCGDSYTPIYTIQGSGAASPLAGEQLVTEGIVVGDFQADKGGFFLQDAAGDGDDATSDGIYVYYDGTDVNVGDHIRIVGNVNEYYELTEFSSIQGMTVCSTKNEMTPVDLYLPVSNVDDFEPFEGMLVHFPQELNISEYYDFDRYGEIALTAERQFQPTAVFTPGSTEAEELTLANSLGRITLDDGRSSQNPDPAIHPNGYVFDLNNLFRGGDKLTNVIGVLDYNFGQYVIQPTYSADYIQANPRPEVPDVSGSLKIGSFNVLNYFTTIDEGSYICGPAADMECRGADTAEEFKRQHDKIIAALAAINADIVGLIEIENNIDDSPTAYLVDGLNSVVGAGTYSYIATGAIGTDAIRVALIYKPAKASPIGPFGVLDASIDARFVDDRNRPTLAQSFQDLTGGGIFTVAVNHLKSKGSACDDLDDPDTGDGSSNCNLTRTAAAEALVDWLATDPTDSGSDKALIIGDLNSYDKEQPVQAIKEGADDVAGSDDDYIDLLDTYEGEYSYSYVFDGQLGYLDHALASSQFFPDITGAAIWHINADEADLIDYDMTYKQDAQDLIYAPDQFRASDHDAVLVGVSVCEDIAPTIEVALAAAGIFQRNHKYILIEATVTASDNFTAAPKVTLVSVAADETEDGRGDGHTCDDIKVIDYEHFLVRAESSGRNGDRTYTATYSATDDCDNTTTTEATVTVDANGHMKADKHKSTAGKGHRRDNKKMVCVK